MIAWQGDGRRGHRAAARRFAVAVLTAPVLAGGALADTGAVCEPGETGGVTVEQHDERATTTLIAINRYHAPVHLSWHLDDLNNARAAEAPRGETVIGPCGRGALTSVHADSGAGSWSFGYGYRYLHGDPSAVHEYDSPYRAPFAPGDRVQISQAWPDAITHTDAASAHAVDFELDEGEPVHAARAGTVFQVAAEHDSGGDDRERYIGRANFVRVLHEDGSMALYAHLAPDSVAVRPGQRVERGDRLAAAGSTGFSTGPHLHFAVQVNRAGRIESVPLQFEDADGEVAPPLSGQWLSAGP